MEASIAVHVPLDQVIASNCGIYEITINKMGITLYLVRATQDISRCVLLMKVNDQTKADILLSLKVRVITGDGTETRIFLPMYTESAAAGLMAAAVTPPGILFVCQPQLTETGEHRVSFTLVFNYD